MANITINIPDQHIQRILQAFTANGYNPQADGTKAEYTKQKIIQYIREVTIAYESSLAIKSARESVQQELNGVELT